MHLPEDSVEVFELFLRWLYTQKLTDGEAETRELSWTLLLDLYIFADKYVIAPLQNRTVDLVKEKATYGMRPKPIAEAYDRLPPESPMRSFLVDLMLTSVPEKFRSSLKVVNGEGFMLDLCVAALEKICCCTRDRVVIDICRKGRGYVLERTPKYRPVQIGVGSSFWVKNPALTAEDEAGARQVQHVNVSGT